MDFDNDDQDCLGLQPSGSASLEPYDQHPSSELNIDPGFLLRPNDPYGFSINFPGPSSQSAVEASTGGVSALELPPSHENGNPGASPLGRGDHDGSMEPHVMPPLDASTWNVPTNSNSATSSTADVLLQTCLQLSVSQVQSLTTRVQALEASQCKLEARIEEFHNWSKKTDKSFQELNDIVLKLFDMVRNPEFLHDVLAKSTNSSKES